MKQNKQKDTTGKTFTGTVISAGMKNTIRVQVEKVVTHPLYKKQIKRSKVFAVHSVDPAVKKGDVVTIISTRPISKTKHFKVLGSAS